MSAAFVADFLTRRLSGRSLRIYRLGPSGAFSAGEFDAASSVVIQKRGWALEA